MKRTVFQLFLVSFLAIVLFSCSSPDYLGKSYPPTENVDIFFREADIKKDYEVMGKVMVEVPQKKSLQKAQSKIENLAKAKGADAILFDDVNTRSTGYTRAGGGASKGGKVSVGGSVSKTKDTEVKQVDATLLKYK